MHNQFGCLQLFHRAQLYRSALTNLPGIGWNDAEVEISLFEGSGLPHLLEVCVTHSISIREPTGCYNLRTDIPLDKLLVMYLATVILPFSTLAANSCSMAAVLCSSPLACTCS